MKDDQCNATGHLFGWLKEHGYEGDDAACLSRAEWLTARGVRVGPDEGALDTVLAFLNDAAKHGDKWWDFEREGPTTVAGVLAALMIYAAAALRGTQEVEDGTTH